MINLIKMKNKILIIITFIIFICLFLWSCTSLHLIDYYKRLDHGHKYLALPSSSTNLTDKLLCWIMTVDSPDHLIKNKAVQETWGQRCDKLVLVRNGTKLEEQDGVITIPLKNESRAELWHKVIETFSYLYKNYLHHYHWFMKADDDTYVMVETLKKFLSKSSPERPIYFGHKFKTYVHQGYMSGGSGYVLSRRALQLLVEKGFKKKRIECHMDKGQVEDLEMGHCLESVGVEAGDTRDAHGLPTFLPLSPLNLLSQKQVNKGSWYYGYAFYGPPKPGKECCSNEPISFHYIDPSLMYFIDWILYDVKKPNKNAS